jgi:hypothetical protein
MYAGYLLSVLAVALVYVIKTRTSDGGLRRESRPE